MFSDVQGGAYTTSTRVDRYLLTGEEFYGDRVRAGLLHFVYKVGAYHHTVVLMPRCAFCAGPSVQVDAVSVSAELHGLAQVCLLDENDVRVACGGDEPVYGVDIGGASYFDRHDDKRAAPTRLHGVLDPSGR